MPASEQRNGAIAELLRRHTTQHRRDANELICLRNEADFRQLQLVRQKLCVDLDGRWVRLLLLHVLLLVQLFPLLEQLLQLVVVRLVAQLWEIVPQPAPKDRCRFQLRLPTADACRLFVRLLLQRFEPSCLPDDDCRKCCLNEPLVPFFRKLIHFFVDWFHFHRVYPARL